MTPEKTQAIVIRAIPFGETSAVVTLYTREFGKLRGLAKGAWRPKSAFDGALDLLSTCQVLVLRKSSDQLDVLTEARLDRRFRVGGSPAAVRAAMQIAELLDVLTADADPHPELFDAAEATIAALSDWRGPDGPVEAILVHAELAALRLTGHAPVLDACVECRGPLPATGRTALGMLDGGALCPRCRPGRRSVVAVSAAALDGLRRLAAPGDAWRAVDLPARVGGEVRAIMNTIFANLLGRPLRVAAGRLARSATAGLVLCLLATGGCATLSLPKMPTMPWATKQPDAAKTAAEPGGEADSAVISSEYAAPEREFGWDYFKGENIKKRWKKLVGRGPNEPVARKALTEGDALFREGKYSAAIVKYKVAIDRWPDSTIEEDALWQLAECWFFTDQYPKAEDCYDELVKKYANTRHLDRVAQRQFVIAQYWIALDQRWHLPLLVPNLVDRSRPLFDTKGRALKAYDHVRINDPRGPLADDSLMAQANSHFLHRQWLDADYFYGLLRSEYPDSDFLLEAHLLGLQAKLRAYQGPGYEGGVLDEAEILADQILVQFPDQLDADERERVGTSRAEIAAQQAQRHWNRAEFYAKGKHYTSARIYYALIARDYPKTQLAQASREKLGLLAGKEDVSDNPFPMLTRLLNPDSLKEAELDAMAEADALIARGDTSGAAAPIR
ncbi:MAG: DNA repair protein RecO [Planctomycetia bacterium]|nr:DNA repair protein RecO [Planctomycetia bacterium]